MVISFFWENGGKATNPKNIPINGASPSLDYGYVRFDISSVDVSKNIANVKIQFACWGGADSWLGYSGDQEDSSMNNGYWLRPKIVDKQNARVFKLNIVKF